jgi:hypothetical protein
MRRHLQALTTINPLKQMKPTPRKGGWACKPTEYSEKSDFGNGDGTLGANLNTGLTAQTLVSVHWLGLAILHLEDLSRTGVYALFITGTFVFVNNDFPHGTTSK